MELEKGNKYPIESIADIACAYCDMRGGLARREKHELTITDGKGKVHYTNVSGSECTHCKAAGLDVHDYYRVQNTYGIDFMQDINRLIKLTMVNGIEKWVLTAESLNVKPFKEIDHRLKKVNGK